MPRDVIRRRFRYPSEQALAEDIAAIDRGDPRKTVVIVRGSYAPFPRRFRAGRLFLMPDGLEVGPSWHSVVRSRYGIGDPILTVGTRPRDRRTDWNLLAAGEYDAGGLLAYRGAVVVRCITAVGFFELAVFRPDVELVFHYIERKYPGVKREDYGPATIHDG